jgi:hypothetical protein
VVSGQLRKKCGRVDGKNLENAGEMNFFLMSKVVFLGVWVGISCEGVWRGHVFSEVTGFFRGEFLPMKLFYRLGGGGTVVGGQWPTGRFFVQRFSIFPRFLGFLCSGSDRLLVGFLLILGKLGARGEDFFATELQISTIIWSWVFGLWSWGGDIRCQISARKVPHLLFADFPLADI